MKIWNKPNTKLINLYAKGTVGRNGLVGTKSDTILSYHLQNTQDLFIENKVIDIKQNSINLSIKMYADKKAVQEILQKHKTEWIEKLNKKYNPKSSWELRFFSENKIKKQDVLIQTIDKNQIEEFYKNDAQTIWLIDKNNKKISAENRVRSSGTEKTLRAIFSGHKLEVLELRKEHCWYYLQIGIKETN